MICSQQAYARHSGPLIPNAVPHRASCAVELVAQSMKRLSTRCELSLTELIGTDRGSKAPSAEPKEKPQAGCCRIQASGHQEREGPGAGQPVPFSWPGASGDGVKGCIHNGPETPRVLVQTEFKLYARREEKKSAMHKLEHEAACRVRSCRYRGLSLFTVAIMHVKSINCSTCVCYVNK